MTASLATRFIATARRMGARPAVFDEAGTHTYQTLLGRVGGLASAVSAATDRTRVGLAALTSAEFVVGYFGILLADRVPVPLNFLLDPPTLKFVAEDCNLDTVVAAKPFDSLPAAMRVAAVAIEDVDETAHTLPEPTAAGDDEATLLYTSGTTDWPKGVVLTHRNFLCNVDGCVDHIGISERDVFLGVLPLFHSFGLTTSLLAPLLTGCSVAYLPKFSPQGFFEAIAARRVTLCFAVASMFRALLRGRADVGSLRAAIAGGEALGATLSKRFEDVFGVPLLEGYGLTETSPVVSVNLPELRRAGSVGTMLNWVEARIAEDDELWVRGESVAAGYHNRPEETAAAFAPDGWFRTGDLGRIDADGYLWITGRKKDLIISAGENISPGEIESVLQQHPAVFETAVLGVPDKMRGEVPKAFVTLVESADVDARELSAFCRDRLPRHKVPVAFEFRDELPHSHTGKVHKRTLRQAEGL